jgi:hypothetical protein
MEGNNNYLPADVAATAAIEGWSQDRIDQEMQKYTVSDDDSNTDFTQTQTISQDDLQSVSSNDNQVIDNNDDTPPQTSFDFSQLGFNNAEELKSYIEKAKEYEQMANKYKEVEHVIPYANDIQKPFANDNIQRLNNFVRTTGIDDLNLAAEILNTSDDQLKTDPVRALAILEILNDKDLAILGFDRVMEYVANKNNLDVDIKYDNVDEMPVSLRIEAQKALKSIENKRKEFDSNQDYFTYLQNQRADSQRAMDERAGQWQKILQDIPTKMQSIPITLNVEDVGEVTVNYAVSKDDLQRFIPDIQQYMLGLNPDNQGIETAMKVLENRVWLENRDQIMKQVLKSAAGKIKEDTVRNVHNGGKVVDRKDAPNYDVKESPHLSATRAALGL